MKNITRLALAFAVATIACLSPMAHADEAQLVPPDIPLERFHRYEDEDGLGTLVVKDGPKNSYGKWITVTIDQNGYTYSGKGWRSLASEGSNWFAYCEFWVYGSGISAKFKGYLPLKSGYGGGGGEYFLNGSGSPYVWACGPAERGI
jgi:hypothetical protein